MKWPFGISIDAEKEMIHRNVVRLRIQSCKMLQPRIEWHKTLFNELLFAIIFQSIRIYCRSYLNWLRTLIIFFTFTIDIRAINNIDELFAKQARIVREWVRESEGNVCVMSQTKYLFDCRVITKAQRAYNLMRKSYRFFLHLSSDVLCAWKKLEFENFPLRFVQRWKRQAIFVKVA